MGRTDRVEVKPGMEDAVIAETILKMKAREGRDIPAGDPVNFVKEILGDDPWELQVKILESVRDNKRTVVPKCHSSGGTRAAAQAVVWWLYEYDDGVVWTLAPTWTQVRDLLWKDIEDLYNNSKFDLGGNFLPSSCRWEFGPRQYAIGRSTDKPERLQGPHGGHLLIIIDEASGFPEQLEQAIEGMMASGEAHILMLSQPTQLSGMFYRACHSERDLYNVLPVSAYDTPNLTVDELEEEPRPYLVNRDWVKTRRRKWGIQSPLYAIRVLGKFPDMATDSIVSVDSVERAASVAWDKSKTIALGVDVARFGDSYTAYTMLEGNRLKKQWRTHGKNLMETAGQVKRIFDQAVKDEVEIVIAVDDTGLGGGVTDRLREQNVDVRAINFGMKPYLDEEDCLNRGSQIWWNLGLDLTHNELLIPKALQDRETLLSQLLQPVYTFTSAGKIRVVKLGIDGNDPSPDLGDSLALANDARKSLAHFMDSTGSIDGPTMQKRTPHGQMFGIGASRQGVFRQ